MAARDVALAFLESCIEQLAQYGRHPDGGMERLAYTPAWEACVAHYCSWLEEEGLGVRKDAVGNVFGVLEGREAGPSILTGSHIDTALRGGRLDGTLGVIAGFIALRTLKRTLGQPKRTLESLAICDEEASRFHSNFWGSRAIAGLIRPGEAESIFDASGTSLAEAMRACGLDPSRVQEAERSDIDTFVELHIEQGPVLERSAIPIGVVNAITAIEQLECEVVGRADHAGAFPMDARLDPMIGFSEMVLAASEAATRLGPPAVATIGRVRALPGSPNIVAASVTFTLDARYPAPGAHERYLSSISTAFAEIAKRQGLGYKQARLLYQPATECTPELVETIKSVAADLGVPFLEMVSGAGHDTQVLARGGVKRAMIFVPSISGRSHSPDEWTHLEDMATGIDVLVETLRRLAY